MKTYSRLAIILLGLAALSLAGCGRRGPLEPATTAEPGSKPVTRTTTGPDGTTSSTLLRGVTAPKQPFFLDPLL
jgi:predicted small lipoprotein YifL